MAEYFPIGGAAPVTAEGQRLQQQMWAQGAPPPGFPTEAPAVTRTQILTGGGMASAFNEAGVPMSSAYSGGTGVQQAGVGLAVLPAVLGAVGVTMPAWATALFGALGVGGAIVGGAQALGYGEGEGLFGLDILGGGNGSSPESYLGPVPLGGPGLKEPPAQWVQKEWHVSYDWGRLQNYLVVTPTNRRYIYQYNTRTKKWKYWPFRTPRLAIIGKNMPSHKMITRLRRNLSKHRADADTILRLTSPKYQAYKSRTRARTQAHHRR